MGLRALVEDFLFREAELLDEWRLDEWLDLWEEDGRYVVPTTDLPEGDASRQLVFIDDDMVALRGRIRRLKSRHAHREYPWSRTLRLITNVRVREEGGACVAWANFAVYRSRDPGGRWSAPHEYVGQYFYRLVRRGEDFRIKVKKVVLQMEGLTEHGAVSIIL